MSTIQVSMRDLRNRIEGTLRNLVDGEDGILGCVLATEDGIEIFRHGEIADVAEGAAAVTSSLLGLAHTASETVGAGRCRDVFMDCTDGKIVVMTVPGVRPPLVIAVRADRTKAMGSVIYLTRAAARQAAARLL